MTAKRNAGQLATALLAVSLLAACSGSDEDPLVKPTVATSTTPTAAALATPDPDGLTPEEREVFDAVVTYGEAVLGRGASPIGPAIEGLTTQEVYDNIVASETQDIDDADKQYIGDVTFKPSSVTISGDSATVEGCRDGSQVYVVKRGDTQPGVGSRQLGYTDFTYTLVREGGKWLISEPRSLPANTC